MQGDIPKLPCSQARALRPSAPAAPSARGTHLHVREGGLEQVEHLAVGQHVPAGHLVVGSLARFPLGFFVEDVALADAPHFVATADSSQDRHGQHLAQVHGAPVGGDHGPCRAAAGLTAQAEEAEAAGQEARVKVVEHTEPQQTEHGHPQRGQADAHGGHDARCWVLGAAALTGLPAPAASELSPGAARTTPASAPRRPSAPSLLPGKGRAVP